MCRGDPERGRAEAEERMADECDGINKDELITRPPKKSPLILKMIVLALAMVCGVYMCSLSLKQFPTPGQSRLPRVVAVNNTRCSIQHMAPAEFRLVHYPKPVNYSRNECSCTPVRFFAVLSMQRSGSGWFETLLNSHVNVSSNGEIFSVKERRSNMSNIKSTLDKVYNLDWLSSAAKNECTSAVGFKWMLNQGLMQYHEEIVSYFNRRGVSAIFLFRKNLLRRLVSVLANSYDQNVKLLNGTHKSHVHSKKEAGVLAKYQPSINATLLVSDLNSTEMMVANALEHFKGARHITLFYEDVVRNRTKLMDALEFLRVPKQKLVSRQVKIHTQPLSKQIENWEAVYTALKGTKYERFLDSDYPQIF